MEYLIPLVQDIKLEIQIIKGSFIMKYNGIGICTFQNGLQVMHPVVDGSMNSQQVA
ncbi:MAG: hypothetical protein WDM78_10815 [Puia sp.]